MVYVDDVVILSKKIDDHVRFSTGFRKQILSYR